MPKIIAQNIARIVSQCSSADTAREAAEMTLRIAAENGYDQSSLEIVDEVCSHLQTLATAETDEGCKQRITDAIKVVRHAADAHRRGEEPS